MKKTPKGWNTTLGTSAKQKKELALRSKVKMQLIIMYGNKCMTCGDKNRDWRGITLSHKIPLSRGGKTDYDNCTLECYPDHEKYEKKPGLRIKDEETIT